MARPARPTRQSGRTRKANPKYVNGGWDERALAILRESGSPVSGDEDLADDPDGQADESDAEFDASQLTQDGPGPGISTPTTGKGDGSRTAVSPDLELDEDDYEDDDIDDDLDMGSEVDSLAADQETPVQAHSRFKDGDSTHVRGLLEMSWKLGKTRQYPAAYGQTIEDLEEVLTARDIWLLLGRDATLPSRATMSKIAESEYKETTATNLSDYGISQSEPATTPLADQFQKIAEIDLETLRDKGYMTEGPNHQLVLGPWKRERLFNLPCHHVLGLSQAWRLGANRQPLASDEQARPSSSIIINGIDPSLYSIDDATDVASQPSCHEGWLINVGERMQALAWAPQHSENEQYLAVACRSTTSQYESVPMPDRKATPGLSPSARYPSSIQLWRFGSKLVKKSRIATLDMARPPSLCMVVACLLGGLRELKWAPQMKPEVSSHHLGTIAILSTDGCVHLLKIPIPERSRSYPTALLVERPATTLEPPAGLIFTTFAFAGGTDIAVGGSDGTVRLYNFADNHPGGRPEPYMTVQIHVTYVLALAPAGVGELSHFLASGSATGDLVLTDLRAPIQDRLYMQKTRLPTKNLVYSHHTRSWVTTVDHSGGSNAVRGSETKVIAHSLRQFYAGHQLSRFSQGMGSATALAGSVRHPFVLAGNSQGTIICQNVARRMLPAAANIRAKPWVHKLCQYDWIPQDFNSTPDSNQGVGQSLTNPRTMDSAMTAGNASEHIQQRLTEAKLFHGKDTRPGISRFHEGFKPERQDLSNAAGSTHARPKRKKGKTKPAAAAETGEEQEGEVSEQAEDVGSEIVFEEEQAVTVIAWNENIECATWAAIGWGSGILRVQDLSHDADPR